MKLQSVIDYLMLIFLITAILVNSRNLLKKDA